MSAGPCCWWIRQPPGIVFRVQDNLDSFIAGWTYKKNAALYFPRLRMPDPLQENRLEDFPPSGAIAGILARTDAQRGVWKAPAG